MFSFNFFQSGLQRFARVTFVLLVSLIVFSAAGCTLENETGDLNGTWVNIFYDSETGTEYVTKITINTLSNTIEYENSYEGEIVNSPDYTASYGFLIIKFTKYWDIDWDEYPDIKYMENTVNVGKFGALYWRELKSNSVLMADLYDGWDHVMYDDYSEANEKFKMVNSIDWSKIGAYTK